MTNSPHVSIIVGPNKKIIKLPRDLLIHHSSYFRACFGGAFKEAKEGVLRLPDDDPKYFELLLEYFQNGVSETLKDDLTHPYTQEDVEKTVLDLFRLVKFGDKYDLLDLPAMKAGNLKRYFRQQKDVPGNRSVDYDHYTILDLMALIGENELAFCLEVLPNDHPVLQAIAGSCLYDLDSKTSDEKRLRPEIQKRVEESQNLAAQMMCLLVKGKQPDLARSRHFKSSFWVPEKVVR